MILRLCVNLLILVIALLLCAISNTTGITTNATSTTGITSSATSTTDTSSIVTSTTDTSSIVTSTTDTSSIVNSNNIAKSISNISTSISLTGTTSISRPITTTVDTPSTATTSTATISTDTISTATTSTATTSTATTSTAAASTAATSDSSTTTYTSTTTSIATTNNTYPVTTTVPNTTSYLTTTLTKITSTHTSTESSSSQNSTSSFPETSSTPPATSTTDVTLTPQPPPPPGPIIAAVLVPVAVIACVVAAVFYFRNRKSSDHNVPGKTSRPIDIRSFDGVVREMNANSQLKFSEEFTDLSGVGRDQSKEISGLEANREKNRFTDIKPYDISRVKLSINPNDESDYINASWIPGYYSRRQYIAAQGPLPSTQDDFWKMVWEYNCQGIIMLTKLVELNKIKCSQYWPVDNEVVMYGDIAVNMIGETEGEAWIVREFQMSMGQQRRSIKHCFYTTWPDMNVPEEVDSIINFIHMVRRNFTIRGSSPLIVHCSAGVGRTGTFIALDTALYQVHEEEVVDIFGIVYKMRMNRVSMVQNERQFIFIYQAVAQMIKNHLDGVPIGSADIPVNSALNQLAENVYQNGNHIFQSDGSS